MYEQFYNLKERAFNLTPDPRFMYFTERHCEALANLVYGIRERKGFLVLSGEAGTGKTTLINALLDTLERASVLSALIFNPLLSVNEFFEYLLADFNLKADSRSKSQVLIKLNSLLLERYRMGQVTVLIIDEAQNLCTELLEEIRLLTNLETSTEKLLQILLVGQPELSLKLNSPELRQLKQRISLRCALEPLTLFETKEYINTRLEIAGLPNQQIFPDACVAEIFRCSGGIPRLVNTLCDNAMLTGYACDAKAINVDIIREVADDLELSDGHQLKSNSRARAATQSGLSVEGVGLTASPGESAESSSKQRLVDSDSFDLFVQFVDKLRDRNKSGERS
jgi:general secretion pathway protein A